jgi:iron complex outermembrane recepter protein
MARAPTRRRHRGTKSAPGYALVNLMAGYSWKVGPRKLSLQLNIDNLLDKEFFESFNGSNTTAIPGTPRTFLGSVRVEY